MQFVFLLIEFDLRDWYDYGGNGIDLLNMKLKAKLKLQTPVKLGKNGIKKT